MINFMEKGASEDAISVWVSLFKVGDFCELVFGAGVEDDLMLFFKHGQSIICERAVAKKDNLGHLILVREEFFVIFDAGVVVDGLELAFVV